MARKEMFVDDETCHQCSSTNPGDLELFSLTIDHKNNFHCEHRECRNCGAQGRISYHPPASKYKLNGELFGEPTRGSPRR